MSQHIVFLEWLFRSKAEMGVISGREIYDREKEMEREAGSDDGEGHHF